MFIADRFNANLILSNKIPVKAQQGKKNFASKKRGRPLGVKNRNITAEPLPFKVTAEKLPGDISFPLTCWSLTVTKTGGDIHKSLLDNMNNFLQDVCTRGILLYYYLSTTKY